MPDADNQAISTVSTASGIFRGLLNNVSGSIVGLNPSQTNPVYEARIKSLEEQLSVLQEELESKILENERLVMDCCETRREQRDAELRVKEASSEIESGRIQLEKFRGDFTKLEREKSALAERVESGEITIDGLRREIQLQGESSLKTRGVMEGLNQRVSELSLKVCELESEKRDHSHSLSIAESRISFLTQKLEESASARSQLAQELAKERSRGEAMSIKVAQLEEDISVVSLQSTTAASSPGEELDEDSLVYPSCKGDVLPRPCCYRAEHYLSQFRTSEMALKSLSAKQKEWTVNMSELFFLRNQNDQLKQDLNELS